jgi:GTPase involved in cell partitioning and DNA repair
VNEFDKEEQKEIRILEVEFEKKYKEIYAQRELIINGKMDLPKDLIEEFGVRVKEMQDEDYAKLEVTPCDVKSIQNIPKGVSDFWIKAMLNHPPIA